jgi:hypothetical protein
MRNLIRHNIHPVERAARVVLGAALIAMAALGTVGAWGYLGVIPLATGAVGTCPLYTLLGMSTCPRHSRA